MLVAGEGKSDGNDLFFGLLIWDLWILWICIRCWESSRCLGVELCRRAWSFPSRLSPCRIRRFGTNLGFRGSIYCSAVAAPFVGVKVLDF